MYYSVGCVDNVGLTSLGVLLATFGDRLTIAPSAITIQYSVGCVDNVGLTSLGVLLAAFGDRSTIAPSAIAILSLSLIHI